MKGTTHVLVGCASVLPAALAAGLPSAEVTALTVVAAGFSLGPDIDHPNATITRAAGQTLHLVSTHMSAVARNVTSTGLDEERFAVAAERGIDPNHRSLTHTLVFAVAMAGGAYAAAHLPFLCALLMGLCAASVYPMFPRRMRPFILGAALAVGVFGYQISPDPDHVALAAAAGWVSHVVADACTRAGVPLLWPVKIKSRRWYRFRLLGTWITVGESREYAGALLVVAAMNVPVLWM